MEFAQEIAIFLEKGNWQVTSRAPTPLLQKSDEALPSAMAAGGQPGGITIVANAQDVPPYGFKEPDLIHPENDVPTVPFESLQRALLVGVGKLGTHIGGANVPSKGTLRIVVSPKDPVRP